MRCKTFVDTSSPISFAHQPLFPFLAATSPGILTATADGTVVMVTFINVNSVMSVQVTATSDGGMVYYYNLPSPVGLCLSGLSPNTMFTICATFTLAAGTSEGDCYFQKVQTGTVTSGQLCSAVVTMSPSGTIAGPTSGMSHCVFVEERAVI